MKQDMKKDLIFKVLGNIKVGNSKEKLLATMLQCLPYIGFPNIMNTINIIKSI